MAEINTIVFDIGNVLVDFRWENYLKDCGYPEDVIIKIGSATVRNQLWKKWDRGDIEVVDMIESCCKQEPKLEKEIRKFFEDLILLVREFDYSSDFIQRLKSSGYQVYLLSNYPKYFFELGKEYLKFFPYVDGCIISYEVNRMKPEPDIYQALIDKYGFNTMEAVFLDDLAENLEAAKPFGFHTIQVKSYEQMLDNLRMLGIRI